MPDAANLFTPAVALWFTPADADAPCIFCGTVTPPVENIAMTTLDGGRCCMACAKERNPESHRGMERMIAALAKGGRR